MRRTLMVMAAGLAVAACSPDAPATEAPETEVAAPDARSAEAFVRSLYEGGDRAGGESGRCEEQAIWSARTAALLAESVRLTPEDEVGFFEADPICDCQDGTPVLQSASATMTGPDSADVAVVQGFAEPGAAVHRKTYNLVREGGQWRIDDQQYDSMGDFPYEPMLQRLNAWIAEAEAR